MDEFKDLIQREGKIIRIYIGKETQSDPFEKNVSISMENPIPIKGLVTDLVSSQIQWKIPGIRTEEAKELIIPKRHRGLIEMSHKIQINNYDYIGWRDNNGKMQIREEGNYIRCVVYSETNK